jgi:cyclopropane fatty-acyl-phospholipid synthase-like methyltransferase
MRSDKDITDYLKSQPVANLSRAIGVNDRFLFIRELFNGNSESYSQAIIKIDEAKNLSDAKTLIQNFAGDKVETEAGKHLLDFVKRKFPADE